MALSPSIAWWELVGRDLAQARQQYAALGWHFGELGLRQRYPVWTVAGQGRAGWVQLPAEALAAGAVAHWMPCALVGDLEALVRRAERLSGQVVVEPSRVAQLGRVATVVDPQGAAITLLQPAARLRRLLPPAVPPPLLWAADPQALAPFYTQLFGWQVLGPRGPGLLLGRPEGGAVELAPRPVGAPPLWLPRWPLGKGAAQAWLLAGGRIEAGVLVDGEGVASLGQGAPAPV